VEHVGSTSIPGCLAKPILDLLVIHSQNLDFQQEAQALEALGFTHKGAYGIEGRNYFNFYNVDKTWDYTHIHAYPEGHIDIATKRAFRNALRNKPELREEYNEMKTRLIAQGVSRKDYPYAKSPFILKVLRDEGVA